MDEATWRAKAEKDNKGRSPDTLAYRPEPRIKVGPVASKAPSSSRPRGEHTRWLAIRTHLRPTNEAILADLNGGLDGVRLDRRAFTTARELARLIKGVDMESTHFSFAEGDVGGAAALVGLWRGLGLDASALRADFGLDPIGHFARDGFAMGSTEEQIEVAAELAQWAAANTPNARTFCVDASIWHDAGADDSLTLGLAAAGVAAYLRAVGSADTGFAQVSVRLAVGGRFLLGIGTIRAARRIFARMGELCGVDADLPLVATASGRERSEKDPWVNILRITTAAFGAIVGGVDTLDLPPYAAEDEERARLARNTQLILRDEAHLARVVDPAGGSWAVEQLTDALALEAWKTFQEVEAAGGLLAAVRKGWVAERIRSCRARREKLLRSRSQGILGVSRFADLDESAVPASTEPDNPTAVTELAQKVDSFEELLPSALRDPLATLTSARHRNAPNERCEPCPPFRRAEAWERLRQRPRPPRATVLAFGPLPRHMARSAWGEELLAAGGIRSEVVSTTPEQAVLAYQQAGHRIVVLSAVGSDFAALPDVARALIEAGAAVWVLGDPGEQRTAFESAAVRGFLHQGIDALGALHSLWEVK